MSQQIDTALVQSYRNNIDIGFQQRGSRLRKTVRNETQHAEYDYYDRIGSVEAQEVTTRHGDTPLNETPHDRRRVGLKDYDWADLIDNRDKLRMLADPTSSYVKNGVMALGRAMDRQIIAAAHGTAYTGKDGTTQVSFTAGQVVSYDATDMGTGSTEVGLSIAKLRKAKRILEENEVIEDGDEVFCIVTAKMLQQLLQQTEITSADYNTIKALVEGKVDTFMGMKFVRTQLLTVESSTYRRALVYPRQAMLTALSQEITVRVDELPTKRYSVQVYVKGSFGSSRMWEEAIVGIDVDETYTFAS